MTQFDKANASENNFSLLSRINQYFGKSTWLDTLEKGEESLIEKSFVAGKVVFSQFYDYNDLDGLTVLDFGCGSGLKTAYYATQGAKLVYGLDRDIANTGMARDYAGKNGLNIVFKKIDDNNILPLPNDSVDIIVSSSVIEHISDLYKALQEIRRVLKPGGLFLNRWHPFRTRYGSHLNDVIGIPFLHLLLKEETVVRFFISELVSKYGKIPNVLNKLSYSSSHYSDLNFMLNFKTPKEVKRMYSQAGFQVKKRRYYLGTKKVFLPKLVPSSFRELFFDYQIDILS